MEKFGLVEYLPVAAKKFFGNRLSKFEQTLLKFFGNIIKHPAEKHRVIFDELTFALKRAQDSNGILNYFDFISWAKAHAEGKKLFDVLKENLKEK